MPAPRPAVIVLLLVLVAVVILFIVGQSLGAQQPSSPSEGEIASLKDRFFGKEVRVSWPPGDQCPRVYSGTPCNLVVPPAKEFLRTVVVTSSKPMKVDFVPASTPDRTITLDMTDSKSLGKPAKVMVDGKGGRLTLICAAPSTSSPCTPTVQ